MILLNGSLLFSILIVGVVKAVDHSKFKTCSQSGFCQRLRYPASRSEWHSEEFTYLQQEGLMTWQLKEGEKGHLEAKVTSYEEGIFRMIIDEPGRGRYRLPKNIVILDSELKTVLVKPTATEGESKLDSIVDNIRVEVDLDLFLMSIYSSGNEEILTINKMGLFGMETDVTPREEVFQKWTDPQIKGIQGLSLDISFPYAEDSGQLFGLAEHATSLSLKSTNTRKTGSATEYQEPYRLYNLDVFEYELDSPMSLYGSIPFVMAVNTKGEAVGILWNNPSETFVDIFRDSDATPATHFMSEAGIIDLFIFTGPSALQVLSQYYKVTGKPYMPPMFAFGFHQCRWNYMDEDDVMEVHDSFLKDGVPMDVLWLDIEHTDGKRYLTWDKSSFPDPVGMQERLIGRKLVVIIDPHIKMDNSYELYKELKENPGLAVRNEKGSIFEGHCWPGTSVWPDFTQEATQSWWMKHLAVNRHEVYFEYLKYFYNFS